MQMAVRLANLSYLSCGGSRLHLLVRTKEVYGLNLIWAKRCGQRLYNERLCFCLSKCNNWELQSGTRTSILLMMVRTSLSNIFKALCWQGLTQRDSRYCAKHLQLWLSAGQIEGSTCPAVPICGTDIADFSNCIKNLQPLSLNFKKSVALPLAHEACSELDLPVTILSHCPGQTFQ